MSLTILGLMAAGLATFARSRGIDADKEHFLAVFMTIAQLAGFVAAWYGRIRKGDLTWWGGRK